MAVPTLNDLRNTLSCPISYDLFQDPVTENGSCGHTFERADIEAWLTESQTCPLTRNRLRSYQLVANQPVKEACQLLDPDRNTPLTARELRLVNEAADAVSQRGPVRVPEDTHERITDKIRAAADRCLNQSKNAYGC